MSLFVTTAAVKVARHPRPQIKTKLQKKNISRNLRVRHFPGSFYMSQKPNNETSFSMSQSSTKPSTQPSARPQTTPTARRRLRGGCSRYIVLDRLSSIRATKTKTTRWTFAVHRFGSITASRRRQRPGGECSRFIV